MLLLSEVPVDGAHVTDIFSKLSGNSSTNNELVAKTFQICKNFPVSIADALTGFLRLWRRWDWVGWMDGYHSS